MADKWETILLTVFNSLTMIVGICGNLLLIISFLFYNTAREATELFLVSLSVADILVCVVYQPLLIYRANHPDHSEFYVSCLKFFGYGLPIASLNGLLAVTVDRFVFIYQPYKYVYWMTDRHAAWIISASWITSLIMAILYSTRFTVFVLLTVLCRAVFLVLVPLLCCVIYREARKQARCIAEHCSTASQQNVARPTNKATKGVALVLSTTIICWLPATLFPPFLARRGLTDDVLRTWMSWCMTAASLNSCLNPFIYYWQFSRFRRAIGKSFQRIRDNIADSRMLPKIERHAAAKEDDDPSYTERRSAWVVTEHAIIKAQNP